MSEFRHSSSNRNHVKGNDKHSRSQSHSATTLRSNSSRKKFQSPGGMDGGFEEILRLTLVQIAQINLKGSAARSVHDVTSFSSHLQSRAEQIVDEELSAILSFSREVTGSAMFNKVAAYSQVSSMLLKELERVTVTGDHKIQLSVLRDSNQTLRNESSRIQAQLSEDLARRDQRIKDLETEKSILEYKNASLLKTVELLSSELERCTRTLSESQQNYVNLCLQSLQLKGEVDDSCDKVVESISSRIGFVPNNVMKAVIHLKGLKPPGDPSLEVVKKFKRDRLRKKAKKNSSPTQRSGDDLVSINDSDENNEIVYATNSLNNSFSRESSRIDLRADGLLYLQADKQTDNVNNNGSNNRDSPTERSSTDVRTSSSHISPSEYMIVAGGDESSQPSGLLKYS